MKNVVAKVVVIEELKNFDLKQTLECGQVFRYEKVSENSYTVIANNKRIRLTQKPESTTLMIHNSTISEYEEIWKDYLDIETDYEHIISQISKDDPHMQEAIAYGQGIRVLNQDTWEMLISFIVSQNKAIPHIQQCIQNLCEAFGEKVTDKDGEIYYAFPTAEELSKATEEELRECKVGFRAPYIMDACQKVKDNTVVLEALPAMSTQQAKETLMKIKGVGEKVAHCVLLFGLNKTDTFPTDVWIKRIMQEIYFDNNETKNQDIIELADQKYGDYAGYAQQYLFYYGRQTELDKKAQTKQPV
ncbi:MAG TPA: DNA-3-methyladenine glycosylase 2 family protein [Epulopiscium sp.]|nr:DNA-3-methyladenine glycosylase 2 family protein [Candidatus Epulonipiscium sp.]